jgi:hypothetical protein
VGLRRHAAGAGRRPLLVVLDCKGGADARQVADRARRVLREAGARSTAIWPDEASLSLWALAPQQLTTTLEDRPRGKPPVNRALNRPRLVKANTLQPGLQSIGTKVLTGWAISLRATHELAGCSGCDWSAGYMM